MLFDWNTYQTELTKSIPDFAKLSPDSLKAIRRFRPPMLRILCSAKKCASLSLSPWR